MNIKITADSTCDLSEELLRQWNISLMPMHILMGEDSYLDGVPVCGLPGCVMYAKRTIFDLLLPRLLADDPITAEDIARLGEGGLCLGCAECHWPNCGFGHC